MCGIAGATRNLLGDDPDQSLERMNAIMVHRGPDMGDWMHNDHIGMCHRRLSIIDLSDDGRQPMTTEDKRYSIVFNGEIYNYPELRKELIAKGYRFQSQTDTEVLLYLYADQGTEAVKRIRGMFAFAIWDDARKELFAARDHIGKKPFFYYHAGHRFAFASEIKSILQLPDVQPSIDNTAVVDYFNYLYIPHPKTIYRQIAKLEPGHFLVYANGAVKTQEYWDIDFSKPLVGTPDELQAQLFQLLKDAVSCRLMSDVPLGAFLSGGVDSSGVVALMAQTSTDPVSTCTIGFNDQGHNEAAYAKDFAQKLGLKHNEHYINDEPADIIKKLVWHFDEPFADSSMVPTYYVSKMARQHVTVALSGDGGDESFAGYEKYAIDRYENQVRALAPALLLSSISKLTRRMPSDSFFRRLNSLCNSALLSPEQAFFVTNSFIRPQHYQTLFSESFRRPIDGYDPAAHTLKYFRKANGDDHLGKILYTDLKLFLPGDILVKVDRMSMANSLEVRSPLLDKRVIEFAAKLPSRMKIHHGEKKHILKNAFAPLVGAEVLNRRKHGFTVPLGLWFRSNLRQMAKTTIFDSEPLKNFISTAGVRDIWDQHQARIANHGTLLWSMLMFALWLDHPHPPCLGS